MLVVTITLICCPPRLIQPSIQKGTFAIAMQGYSLPFSTTRLNQILTIGFPADNRSATKRGLAKCCIVAWMVELAISPLRCSSPAAQLNSLPASSAQASQKPAPARRRHPLPDWLLTRITA
jgi:hypothetical protein